jgi:molecular chaperone GrpE
MVPTFDKMREESVQPQEGAEGGEKSLEALLAEAQAKIEQQRDAMMRALADAENARKRAQADIASAHKYALERFAEGLLPVMDSLEAALKSADLSGVEITLKQLRSVLDKSSIREIEPKAGERFDPHRHQAMAAVETQAEPNTVVSVLQKGYSLHDRVLRPALVTIAKTPSGPISDQD